MTGLAAAGGGGASLLHALGTIATAMIAIRMALHFLDVRIGGLHGLQETLDSCA
jgi:hypothetical protein